MTRRIIGGFFLIILLVGGGFYFRTFKDKHELSTVERTELDRIVVALREDRNRLEVMKISGEVTTVRRVQGGPFDVLPGTIKIRQPFWVSYFVDMNEVALNDFIWDKQTRTLIVRTPLPRAEQPTIDASRQIVVIQGPIITRDMQARLRRSAAIGAKQQVQIEAAKAENIASANKAARAAIVQNVKKPLQAAGLDDVTVVATNPSVGRSDEHWDVSRSIAEVLGVTR